MELQSIHNQSLHGRIDKAEIRSDKNCSAIHLSIVPELRNNYYFSQVENYKLTKRNLKNKLKEISKRIYIVS